MRGAFSIGDLATGSGCKVQTIRYYEQIGLMPQPARTDGGQRRYGDGDLSRLIFIRHGRGLGFTIEQIRGLLSLAQANPDASCTEVDKIAKENLQAVETRIVQLESLRLELRRMIDACAGGRVAECRILEGVSDHSLCASDVHLGADPRPVGARAAAE